jgi:prepilin-type N-terminal cleavage/methylation domain-containing protein
MPKRSTSSRTPPFARVEPRTQSGFTLLELIIVCAILLVLASAAMPVARYTVRRQKEAELRRDLREMRDAIDRYKDASDKNEIRVEVGTEGYPPDLDTLVQGVDVTSAASQGAAGGLAGIVAANPGLAGAAASAGIAIPGVTVGGQSGSAAQGSGIPAFGSASTSASTAGTALIRHVRFLRRIPVDPMTGMAMWGMRAVSDDPDSSSWGGKDVFDVFSLSTGMALDGTNYKDW